MFDKNRERIENTLNLIISAIMPVLSLYLSSIPLLFIFMSPVPGIFNNRKLDFASFAIYPMILLIGPNILRFSPISVLLRMI